VCVSSVILPFLFCLSLFHFQCLLSVFIKIGKKQNWPTFLLIYVLPKYSSNFETINQPIAAAFSIFFVSRNAKSEIIIFRSPTFFFRRKLRSKSHSWINDGDAKKAVDGLLSTFLGTFIFHCKKGCHFETSI
jgi:hypothetical protein